MASRKSAKVERAVARMYGGAEQLRMKRDAKIAEYIEAEDFARLHLGGLRKVIPPYDPEALERQYHAAEIRKGHLEQRIEDYYAKFRLQVKTASEDDVNAIIERLTQPRV